MTTGGDPAEGDQAFNRTSMESKQVKTYEEIDIGTITFNRTSMESKQ